MPDNLSQTIEEGIEKIRHCGGGDQYVRNAAILNARILGNLILALNSVADSVSSSSRRIIESNVKTSNSSEKFARSLSRATWILAFSTIALVIVTLVTIFK